MKKNLLAIIALVCSLQSNAQFTVDSTVTPTDMVTAITGGGIVFSNILFTGADASRGTFSCSGACNLGIGSGIILSSGRITDMTGSNTSQSISYNFNLNGDPDLDILSPGTLDASVLEFDFISLSDSAVFNFRFGSEEYNEFVNSTFNDVFGFFISGSGISGNQNIALIPGTTIPVSINNVNNGYSTTIGGGPCMNCIYYEDNMAGTVTTQYDGLTTILVATAANLQPGQTYHLKIAVADVSDHVYDSGVIIEAGSFSIPGQPWLYADGLRITSSTVYICPDSSVTLSAPAGFSYVWNNGLTTQSITVGEGTYSVQITGSNQGVPVVSDPINVVIDPLCEATGLSGVSRNGTVSLYPNPFNNFCKLAFENPSNEKFTLSFFDVTGRSVLQQEINRSETTIEREHLDAGIYFYKLTNADGSKVFKGKVVIE